MKNLLTTFAIVFTIMLLCVSCGYSSQYICPEGETVSTRFIPPDGYTRTKCGGYGEYLRALPMLPDGSPVKAYDGRLIKSGNSHCGVIDMDVGTKDLQQCADSALRLRCEYLHAAGEYDSICYQLTSGDEFPYTMYRDGYRLFVDNGTDVTLKKTAEYDPSYETFRAYCDMLFNYAGTISIERESAPVALSDMQPGDVFVIGGSPGHLIFVLDMAENSNGDKVFLLAQGNTPAQQIHVLTNDTSLSPWFTLDDSTFPLSFGRFDFDESTLKRLR